MEFTQAIREIKNRIPIESKISETVKLKKSGSSLIGLCPFHEEKTPSFHVFQKEGRFYCFGCTARGDVIDFITQNSGLEWREAVNLLAQEAGVDIPLGQAEPPEAKNKLNRMYDLNKMCTAFFKSQLFINKDSGPNDGLKYLYERELTDETINAFNLGYCRNSSELLHYLTKTKSYTESELMESGSFTRTSGGSLRCNFEGRIIFPIRNLNGDYIGFGSRAVLKPVQPKYINSTSSITFDKSKSLYGLYEGYGAIRQQDRVVVVEGFIDVLMAHQYGYKNVIATMGTALGEEHIKLIKRFTTNIVLAFDSDKAGKLAAFKAIDVAKENFGTKLSAKVNSRGILTIGESLDAEIRVASFPESLDADETLRTCESTVWNDCINNAKSIVDYHIESVDGSMMFSAKERTKVCNNIVPLIAEVKNPIERDIYIRGLSNKLSIDDSIIRSEVAKVSRTANGKTKLQLVHSVQEKQNIFAPEVFEDIIMANIIKYFPQSLEITASDETAVATSDFDSELNVILFTKLTELMQSKSNNPLDINNSLSEIERQHFGNLLSYAESQPVLEEEEIRKSIKFLLNKLRRNQFLKVYNIITQELSKQTDVLTEDYMELLKATVNIEQLMKVYYR